MTHLIKIYAYFLTLVMLSTSYAVAQEKAELDMSDPTAVFSSLSASANTEGNFDIEGAVAWGENILSVESKNDFDMMGVTFAHMVEGSGVYADATFNDEYRAASVGYITTYKLMDKLVLYPVATVGYLNDEKRDFDTGTLTGGVYSRYLFGEAFHLGFDPFFTLGRHSYDVFTYEAFVGYQYKTHRFRVGMDDDKDFFAKVTTAF